MPTTKTGTRTTCPETGYIRKNGRNKSPFFAYDLVFKSIHFKPTLPEYIKSYTLSFT
jgi:hypothetical protein